MNFIKLTRIRDHQQVFVPSGAQLTSQAYGSLTITQSNSIPYYQSPVYYEEDIYLPNNIIKFMTSDGKLTTVYFIDTFKIPDDYILVKETPEQIMKINHNKEFNTKMDDILK